MAFTSDGSALRVVGQDGTYRELPAQPGRAVPIVCARAGRALTAAEWRDHVGPDLPFARIC